MTSPTLVIGYVASTTSILAFGSQFYHTCKTKSTAGISLQRIFLDTVSLCLWVLYATRVEDIPLLIATITEISLSVCVCVMVLRNRRHTYSIKDFTPPATPPLSMEDSVTITIRTRSNSV